MAEEKHMHEGHRQRMFERYNKTGFDGFSDHEILEMLLFYVFRQKDTNTLAHKILDKYGTLRNVFRTSVPNLMQIEGIGKATARYLNIIGQTCDFVDKVKDPEKLNSDNAHDFFNKLFKGKEREEFYIICLDPKNNILNYKMLDQGGFENTEINLGKAIKTALDYDSAKVIFAHNHPSGIDIASDADITVTSMLESSMHLVGVKMIDHIIYAGGKCISIMQNYRVRKDRSFEKRR